MIARKTQLALLAAALGFTLGSASDAIADANSWATVGLGASVVHTNAPGQQEATATAFAVSVRAKALYFLGIDVSAAPGASHFDNGDPRPKFRLTALLYLVNARHFALHLGAGMLAANVGDLVDFQAPTTYLRAGGGIEISFDGHYSMGLEGYLLAPGLGLVNGNLNRSLAESGELPEIQTAVPLNGYEIAVTMRYFF